MILFAPNSSSGFSQIAAAGGEATTALPLQVNDVSYRWPSFLPDGRHFLFYSRGTPDRRGIYVGSLGSTTITRVLDTNSSGVYTTPGYLLTARDGVLLAYPFDVQERRVTGDPIQVAEDVGGTSTQRANFSVSNTGVLAHSRGLSMLGRLTWFDREGKALGSILDVGDFPSFALSRDGTRVAVSEVDPRGYTPDIWLFDIARGRRTRFTFDSATDGSPVWSPDGTRMLFRSDRMGGNNLFEKGTSGSAPEVALSPLDVAYPTDLSPDGKYIAFHSASFGTNSYDVLVLPRTEGAKPVPVAATEFTETGGRFSSDGRFIAYASDESGQFEVYVQPFPTTGEKWQVSAEGGVEPQWRQDGPELFYLGLDRKLFATSIISTSPFDVAPARVLFQTGVPLTLTTPNRNTYAASGDGRSFLVNTDVPNPGSSVITVVINWAAELKK